MMIITWVAVFTVLPFLAEENCFSSPTNNFSSDFIWRSAAFSFCFNKIFCRLRSSFSSTTVLMPCSDMFSMLLLYSRGVIVVAQESLLIATATCLRSSESIFSMDISSLISSSSLSSVVLKNQINFLCYFRTIFLTSRSCLSESSNILILSTCTSSVGEGCDGKLSILNIRFISEIYEKSYV